jgi:hypothetical protein
MFIFHLETSYHRLRKGCKYIICRSDALVAKAIILILFQQMSLDELLYTCPIPYAFLFLLPWFIGPSKDIVSFDSFPL